jgi:hypothetical protein
MSTSASRIELLLAKQKQSCDRERNAEQPLPRWRFVKKQNSDRCHDRGAAGSTNPDTRAPRGRVLRA